MVPKRSRKRKRNHTLLPSSVADVASRISTSTKSPAFIPSPVGNTTILFCPVRPHMSSLLRLEYPSTSTVKLLPMSRRLLSSDSVFCNAIILLSRSIFTSSATLSGKNFDA